MRVQSHSGPVRFTSGPEVYFSLYNTYMRETSRSLTLEATVFPCHDLVLEPFTLVASCYKVEVLLPPTLCLLGQSVYIKKQEHKGRGEF